MSSGCQSNKPVSSCTHAQMSRVRTGTCPKRIREHIIDIRSQQSTTIGTVTSRSSASSSSRPRPQAPPPSHRSCCHYNCASIPPAGMCRVQELQVKKFFYLYLFCSGPSISGVCLFFILYGTLCRPANDVEIFVEFTSLITKLK